MNSKAIYDISEQISTDEYRKRDIKGMIFKDGKSIPIYKNKQITLIDSRFTNW